MYKILIVLSAIFFSGCGLYLVETTPPEETPIVQKQVEPSSVSPPESIRPTKQDHLKSIIEKADIQLIEGKLNLAYDNYLKALEIDSANIPATIGISKYYLKNSNFSQAFISLDKIVDNIAHTRYAPEFFYLYIQSSISQSGWDNVQLKKIENAYYHALPAYGNKPELYHYMGLICKQYFQYNRAKTFFSKVASFQSPYSDAAYDLINEIKTLEQCQSCGYPQKLPLISQITRADMTYILHHELEIHTLLNRYTKDWHKPSPQKAKDIEHHPLKREIEALLSVHLQGVSLFPDQKFQPEMPLTRADFSQIIFEIINRIEPQTVKEFTFSNKQAIADILPSQKFYRAILFCTRYQIMSPLETGGFDPYGPVSGADALMSIRTLKNFFIKKS